MSGGRTVYAGIAPILEASDQPYVEISKVPPISEVSKVTSEAELREKLIAAQVVSEFDSFKPYVPRHVIGELIDSFLDESKFAFKVKYFIKQRAKRVYATLIHLRMTEKLDDFLRCDFDDSRLPIEYDMRTGDIISTGRLSEKQQHVFQSWKSTQIQDFCNTQWIYTAAVFEVGNYDRTFLPQAIFPFEVLGRPKGTAFSRLYKVKVRELHLEETLMNIDNIMALKETAMNVDAVMDQKKVSRTIELENLKRTSRSSVAASGTMYRVGETFLSQLVTAFQRGQMSYMLFNWASEGNLYDFWRANDPPQGSRVLPWVESRTQGLLAALCLLHDLKCRHGDLKPANVLVHRYGMSADLIPNDWLYRYDQWLITDLDAGRFHTEATQDRAGQTQALRGAPRYAPPETDRDHPDSFGPWSRRYDIWSMGCIYLELLIWLCDGKAGIEDFNEKLGDRRVAQFWKFDRVDESGSFDPVLHPFVVQTIQRLRTAMSSSDASSVMVRDEEPEKQHELRGYLLFVLEQVENRMLVPKVTKAGEDDRMCRITSDELWDSFQSRPNASFAWSQNVLARTAGGLPTYRTMGGLMKLVPEQESSPRPTEGATPPERRSALPQGQAGQEFHDWRTDPFYILPEYEKED